MKPESPFQDIRVRRNSLTYTKERASLTGVAYNQRRRQDDLQFVYRAFVFGALLMAACLYISHESLNGGGAISNKLVGQFLRSPLRRRHAVSTPIRLEYPTPKKRYQRNVWTAADYWVNGVNLAKYGFEATEQNQVVVDELFELYEDFDIGKVLHNGDDLDSYVAPSTTDLLLFRRHLEHATLAFYMDKIAQKRYHQVMGVPTPNTHVMKYKDEWQDRELDREAIMQLLPEKSDFAIKASHKLKRSSMLVKCDEDRNERTMGTKSNLILDEYDAEVIANKLSEDMHQEVNYSDPWALLHVQPGVVVEERFSSFDNPNRPPLELQVYVIWGRVWMGVGPQHPGMIPPQRNCCDGRPRRR